MIKKIYLFLILFLFQITSEIFGENWHLNEGAIKLHISKDSETLSIKNEESAIICIQSKDFEKDYSFYLEFTCDDKNAKINKTFVYKYVPSCYSNNETFDTVEHINTGGKKYDKKPNLEQSSSGFLYEFEFEVKEDKKEGIALLYTGFTGKELKITYSPLSMVTIFIIIGVIILLVIFIIIIVICCICKCMHKKKAEQMQSEFKSSFVEENNGITSPIIPTENQSPS